MKKLLFLLFTSLIFLTACGDLDDTTTKEPTEKETEVVEEEIKKTVISESEHDITLIDNEDMKVTLTRSEHLRLEDYEERDELSLHMNVQNKQNRTFDISFKDLQLDGDSDDWDIGITETEIKPDEDYDITVFVWKNVLSDNKLISFEEHIKGEIIYSDYERGRIVESFSEYINE